MARPIKEGLDYFPLNVDIDQDDKMEVIEAMHGLEGFAVVVKLLMKIYKEGYFYEWTEREQKIFSRRVNVNINTLLEIVNDCIKEGWFDLKLFNEYNILTSKGIQKRYLEAVKRRKEITFVEKYFLLKKNEVADIIGSNRIKVFVINDDEKRVNVNINHNSIDVNVNKSTQRKEKESKEKKSKEKDSIEDLAADGQAAAPAICPAWDFYYKNLGNPSPIIMDEMNRYIDSIGAEVVTEALKRAARDNKKWRYAESILKDWQAAGVKSLADIERQDAAFKNSRKGYGVVRKEKNPDWFEKQRREEQQQEKTEDFDIEEGFDFEEKRLKLEQELSKYKKRGLED